MQEVILQFFKYDHLPPHLQTVSAHFHALAERIVATLPRNAERSVALRKLLESKDAAVRAKLNVDPVSPDGPRSPSAAPGTQSAPPAARPAERPAAATEPPAGAVVAPTPPTAPGGPVAAPTEPPPGAVIGSDPGATAGEPPVAAAAP